MGRPRISIGWLIVSIALLGVPLALVLNAMLYDPIYGDVPLYELGLWPGLVASTAASYALLRRRGNGAPFLWGFAATGWTGVLAYLACCHWRPQFLDPIFRYYLYGIEADWATWLIDSPDMSGLYALNLLVLGLFVGTPQLIAAALGGLVARLARRIRWTST
jgi:hypothetical protein